jgi:predicted RNA methylase
MSNSRHAIVRYDDFYGMLSDSVRMRAYQLALRASVQPGDVVLDLGAGAGILGFMALKLGAAKVYAIEKSDAIELARAIAEKNGFSDRVVFLNANSKDVELPEKVDLIVSETLGSFAVDENTLDFTIDARKRFLREEGRMVPHQLRVFAAPVEAPACFEKLRFWQRICGIDFSPAFDVFSRKIMVEEIAPRQLLARPALLDEISLFERESPVCEAKVYFSFDRPGTVHGFAGWFTADLAPGVVIDTAPGKPPTHWKQAFLPIREPIVVTDRDIMELTLQVRAKENDSDDTSIAYQYRCTQLDQAASPPPPRKAPCPCGSGRKYKHCCGKTR